MEKIRYITQNEEHFLQWGELLSSEVEDMEQGDTIEYTFNVAPDGLEDVTESNSMMKQVSAQVKYFNSMLTFMEEIKKHELEFEIDTDFYWREGDLLVMIKLNKAQVDALIASYE
jgi:hypothetical protein